MLASSSSDGSIACNGGSTTVTVSASGGTSPYSGKGSFTRTAGTYTFVVTDANGCTASTTITITQPAVFFFNDTATSEIYTLSLPAALPISSGGTSPYSGTGSFTRTAGTYTFVVTD